MLKPGISIVIVSWNTKDVTDECLLRIKKAADFAKQIADVEVVVVDNDSTDGTNEMIEKKYPWVILVKSGVNFGYAKGNNLGFRRTNRKNKYLLLINSDTYVEKETLTDSLNYLENNGECDVLGSKLIFENGKMQPSAGNLPTPVNILTWIWGIDLLPLINKLYDQFHPRGEDFFKQSGKVGWVQGAFLFMKREVFEKTKGFDEKFFMYMDEVEWCRRVKSVGYNIFYTSKFSVIHLDRASAHLVPEKMAQTYSLEVVGLLYYLRKYYPKKVRLILPLIKFALFARRFMFALLGNEIRVNAYTKALEEI